MRGFFEAYFNLLDNLRNPVKRSLMDQIDWRHRLIGIKGTRGIGKTTFLLDYAKRTYGKSRTCLYVNLNNFYFAHNSIVDFADEFRKTGGTVLLLDQVFKYPDWSRELSECYLRFPDLKIVFAGSPVMQTGVENSELADKAAIYHLNGLSFREYLNEQTDNSFNAYSFDDILKYHEGIAKDILFKVKPLAFFKDYLQSGYYPYFTENQFFVEYLIKMMNLTLEIDIPYLQQIELKYLPRLKKLLYIIASSAPCAPNVSQLSNEVDTSRATIMNYLKYLQNALLFNLLYTNDGDAKKPSRVLMHNTNLQAAVYPFSQGETSLQETFFVNQVGETNELFAPKKEAHYIVNKNYEFEIVTKIPKQTKADKYYAVDMIESGQANIIPLWLFGFQY